MLNSMTSNRDLAGQVNGMEFCGNCKQYQRGPEQGGFIFKEVSNFPRHLKVIFGIVFDK